MRYVDDSHVTIAGFMAAKGNPDMLVELLTQGEVEKDKTEREQQRVAAKQEKEEERKKAAEEEEKRKEEEAAEIEEQTQQQEEQRDAGGPLTVYLPADDLEFEEDEKKATVRFGLDFWGGDPSKCEFPKLASDAGGRVATASSQPIVSGSEVINIHVHREDNPDFVVQDAVVRSQNEEPKKEGGDGWQMANTPGCKTTTCTSKLWKGRRTNCRKCGYKFCTTCIPSTQCYKLGEKDEKVCKECKKTLENGVVQECMDFLKSTKGCKIDITFQPFSAGNAIEEALDQVPLFKEFGISSKIGGLVGGQLDKLQGQVEAAIRNAIKTAVGEAAKAVPGGAFLPTGPVVDAIWGVVSPIIISAVGQVKEAVPGV
jgi:hypothetical protein